MNTPLDILTELVAAGDDFLSSDSDMGSHQGTVERFEKALEAGKALLDAVNREGKAP